jgi:hypothetical protein
MRPTIILLLLCGGCPDPQARFNDFANRVPDAMPMEHIDAAPLNMLPDVSGKFLMGFAATIAPDQPLQFYMTNTLVKNPDGTGTFTTAVQPLAVADHMPAGPLLTPPPATVNTAGEFDLTVDNTVIPGAANPITGTDITVTIIMHGAIQSADLICGDVPMGNITKPVMLSAVGTTWVGQRIPAGGPEPPLEAKCPSTGGDAGPIDAAMPSTDATPTSDARP